MKRAVFLAALVAFQAGCGRVSGPADGRGADPPWADSDETFCSDLTGSQWVRVWSVPGSVFVGVRVYCLANDVCNDALLARGSAFTLYENRGDGWSMRHRAAPTRAVEPYVTGFADGRVVFGTNDCAVLSVNSDSSATCLQHELGDHAKGVTAAGDDTVLVLRTTDPDQTDLVRLDEKGTSVLESWVGSDPSFLATNGTSVLVSGGLDPPAVWSVNSVGGRIELADPLAGVRSPNYWSGWLFADGSAALGTSDGRIFLIDGDDVREIQSSFTDGVRDMWGAEDKTLFIISEFEFGRLSPDGRFDVLLRFPEADYSVRHLDDVWGNGPEEVFVAVHDIEFGESCGFTGILYFDGTELHRI